MDDTINVKVIPLVKPQADGTLPGVPHVGKVDLKVPPMMVTLKGALPVALVYKCEHGMVQIPCIVMVPERHIITPNDKPEVLT